MEGKLDWNILKPNDVPAQADAPADDEIVLLEPELYAVVSGGDIGSGVIRIPK